MGLNASDPRNNFAYDLHKDVLTKGEATDEEAIGISIENILSTAFGERVFNPYFGSVLPFQLFENITEENGEDLLDKLIEAVETWETRITIVKDKAHLGLLTDENAMTLYLPYIVKSSGVTSRFNKKIIL